MKMTILCLGLCLLLPLVAVADDDADENANALLFEVRGLDNLGLGTFDGGFGFRYFVSDNLAVRPGFHFSSSLAVVAPNSEGYYGTTTDQDSYGVDVVVERHLTAHDRITPYLGLGLSFGETTRDVVYSEPETPVTGQTTGSKDSSEYRAALGVIGVQWRATKALGLGCEYQVTYRYTETRSSTYYFEEDTRSRSQESKSFGYSTSSLYLAVRF